MLHKAVTKCLRQYTRSWSRNAQRSVVGQAKSRSATFQPFPQLRAALVGSGSDGLSEQKIAEAIASLATTKHPKVLYLGAASYDQPGPRQRQTDKFIQAGCSIHCLDIAQAVPSTRDMSDAIDTADIILVSGGNTLYAVDRFVKVGLVPFLQTAMNRGVVLAGGSAGAVCWFDGAHSDSMDPDSYKAQVLSQADKGGDESSTLGAEKKPWDYIRAPGLGFFPGLVCPHYDRVQSNGVPRAASFDQMLLHHSGERGIGIDHWAALLISGDEYELLSPPGREGSATTGKPGLWVKDVVNGEVLSRLAPTIGHVADIFRPATSILSDHRVHQCRLENPV